MSSSVRQLTPQSVWNAFADLNAIPRPSKKEDKAMDFLRDFGKTHGLDTQTDRAGNVIIKKPGSSGRERRSPIILQAHVDMVHQKNTDTNFDFQQQGIQMFVDGDWVKAEGTTLGADNGLGVATILAILSSKDIVHPPIEALFTVDEEAGMGGAKNLQPNLLKGKILLNLDTEEDHVLTIGCAGGLDTIIHWNYMMGSPRGKKIEAYRVFVKGLKGGHSGMDIHRNRGNAIKILSRVLYECSNWAGMCLSTMDGGTARNAIPREAQAWLTVSKATTFRNKFNDIVQVLYDEYREVEPGMSIYYEAAEMPERVLAGSPQKKVLAALNAVHNGVYRMSPDMEGLVETSSNLSSIRLSNGTMTIESLQRSAIESGKADVARTVTAAFDLIGADIEHRNSYPGWKPNPHSPLLRLMSEKYTSLFNEKPRIEACHAGLECGIIGEVYPGLDMVSFGPNILGAHSPEERASISSFQKFWRYLTNVLAEL